MGNRISEIRRAAKVSQLVLADELGWSQGRWSNYESGRRVPGLAESRAIVGVLSRHCGACTLDDVFPPEADQPQAA
jgi:putative transcriptional regulator